MVVRIFGWSIGVTIVSMIVAFLYGGWQALFLVTILGVLEVSLSFDNAVINATVLRRMSEFWQRIFLTIGIIIAVFGMRLLFPLIIVWAASGLGPVAAIDLALNPPADGAATFPDGSPSYETLLTDAHPQIAAFGGMFLLMLFLGFIFEHREITWLSWLERPLARIGRLNQLSVVVASIILVLTAEFLAEDDKISTVMVAGVLGMVTYIAVNGLGELFHVENDSEDAAGGPTALAKATGKAGFFLFLYLEVRDHRRPHHHRPRPWLHRRDVRAVHHRLPRPQGHAVGVRVSRARRALGNRRARAHLDGVHRGTHQRDHHRTRRRLLHRRSVHRLGDAQPEGRSTRQRHPHARVSRRALQVRDVDQPVLQGAGDEGSLGRCRPADSGVLGTDAGQVRVHGA